MTNQVQPLSNNAYFTPEQIKIIKNSICKGATDDEFEIFLMACVKTRLDPFMRQIYAVKRKTKKPDGNYGEVMTIQTGIDGYRLIAERTESYAPGPEPTYTYDEKGALLTATSYIKKLTKDGSWHTVSASAHIDEYMQTFNDKNTGEKKPSGMWANMPRTMLAKCAESQALRKAFPAEMSGIYTKEEMDQAEIVEDSESAYILPDQLQTIMELIAATPSPQDSLKDALRGCKIKSLAHVPKERFDSLIKFLEKKIETAEVLQIAENLPKPEPIESLEF